MSLMNTVWYFGMAISRIVALGLLDMLTVERCSTHREIECLSKTANKDCEKLVGNECVIVMDGFFVEVLFCTVSGVVWYLSLKKILENLQSKQTSDWQVNDDGLIHGVLQG
uniref:Acetyl-coenzyme A transporter 1 n=2 Tax=Melanaphis sacchari TaxID=742174 RepID=A0A2H8TXQ3_9HEMI